MSSLIVSAEGVSVRRRGSGKPRIVVRGNRRKAAQRAKRALQTLMNQDDHENRRSAINSYNPYLILGTADSRIRASFEKVQKAIQDALDAKA